MKQTLISITCKGKRWVFLVKLKYQNGRAVVGPALMNTLLLKTGIRDGQTFTIG